MVTSYNGWPASPMPAAIGVVPFQVNGIAFPGGVKGGDVWTVLHHVASEFDYHVEKLSSPGCWGYSYRENRNAHNLSCHASATAIDLNAPKHPNGVSVTKTFSKDQINKIHLILADPRLGGCVRWGGDFHGTPDAMHMEICKDKVAVRAAARALEEDMALSDADVQKVADAVWAQLIKGAGNAHASNVLSQILKNTEK